MLVITRILILLVYIIINTPKNKLNFNFNYITSTIILIILYIKNSLTKFKINKYAKPIKISFSKTTNPSNVKKTLIMILILILLILIVNILLNTKKKNIRKFN